jgi:uncharacterized protein YndB with AHSA1/START domain
VRVAATRELLAPPEDVWALLGEPYHLSDWWPGYSSVRPDRRGLAAGARWQIVRSRQTGLLRKPGGPGLIVIEAVEPGRALAWRDVEQDFAAEVRIVRSGGNTRAALTLDASWWRLVTEGLRSSPGEALTRLHALCQTAATL